MSVHFPFYYVLTGPEKYTFLVVIFLVIFNGYLQANNVLTDELIGSHAVRVPTGQWSPGVVSFPV